MKRFNLIVATLCLVLTAQAAVLTSGTQGNETPQDSLALDPDYRYAEPTIVIAPVDSTSTQQKEEEGEESGEQEKKQEGYAFVSNNIRVSVDKGERTNGEGIAAGETTFEVKKGGKLTFTATQRIKGLVIDGTVKAAFSATTDKGQLEALYAEMDTEAAPAVVVKNINDTTVTITCNKKLVCKLAKLYFYANPQDKIDGATAAGDTVVFQGNQMVIEYKPRSVYSPMLDTVVVAHDYQLFVTYSNGLDSVYMASVNITAPAKDQLGGTYSVQSGNLNPQASFCKFSSRPSDISLGMNGYLSVYSYGGNRYFVSGYLICQNNNMYYFEYIGEAQIVDHSEGIETVAPAAAPGQTYDLLGRPVDANYRGLIIRNGKKLLNY